MLVMPANNCSGIVHYWAGRYGGLGHLYSPGDRRRPVKWLPLALDNGAFPAFTRGVAWDAAAFRSHLAYYTGFPIKPLWVVVPDVVGNREDTLSRWNEWEPELLATGVPLAFAAQDGMSPSDVPRTASVVFIGGSTDWKREAIGPWCAAFPRVHVGRINTIKWLRVCQDAGAESCDGTGWFRGDQVQFAGLERFITSENITRR